MARTINDLMDEFDIDCPIADQPTAAGPASAE
jgi:hypothetical protein